MFQRTNQSSYTIDVGTVKEYYETWHDRYIDAFGAFFQSARMQDTQEMTKHILSQLELKSGASLLDVGCGVGGPAIDFARIGGLKVKGITLSSKQAETASKTILKEGMQDKVEIVEGDFHRLSEFYKAASFDGIVFLESLVHSSTPAVVLAEVYKVLKINGVLYIKDLFSIEGNFSRGERARIQMAQENTNKYCALHIKPSKSIIQIASEIGFELKYKKDLEPITNHDIGNAFVLKNEIDIYEGQEPIKYLEWAELKFVKN